VNGEFLIRDGGRQVGQLRFLERDDAFVLELVMVAVPARGRGFGTALLGRLILLADAVGKPILALARPIGSNSIETLGRLEQYYSHRGFAVVERGVSSTLMRRETTSAAAAS
jgi:GNAT superfamily N-acetyltransferase